MAEDERISLGPEEAVALWIQGRDVWNAWVEENPNADISFQNVDFGQHRNLETIDKVYWPFANFNFPTGEKNFRDTTFGDGDVSFDHTTFGDGDVFFSSATFGNGAVWFDQATFGNGNVSFVHATFGDDFVSFDRVTFGDGDVWFDRATFGNGNVSFDGATFGGGDVSFFSATFGDGDVWFYRAKFGLGAFFLDAASLGVGGYDFSDATFLGRASFANLVNVKAVTLLSFRHASFGGAFTLGSKEMFSCVPDLVGTKTSHHTSLAELKCASNTATHKKIFKRSVDEGDAERFRRLKELAEQNRDFEKALDFRVEEMRAARWHNKHGFATALVEGLFWLASDYGRSLARPLYGLIGLWLLGAAVYAKASTLPFTYHEIIKAMPFSWGQMFVYIPSSKEARTQGLMALFGEHIPNWLYFITFSQSLLTLVLLFQVGLVLRNRFKL